MRTALAAAIALSSACADDALVGLDIDDCGAWSRSLPVAGPWAVATFNGDPLVRLAAAHDVVVVAWGSDVHGARALEVAVLAADGGDDVRDVARVPLPPSVVLVGAAIEPVDDGFVLLAWTAEPWLLVVATLDRTGALRRLEQVAYLRTTQEVAAVQVGDDLLVVGDDPAAHVPVLVAADGAVAQAPDFVDEVRAPCGDVALDSEGAPRALCFAEGGGLALVALDARGAPTLRTPVDGAVPARIGQLVSVADGWLVVVGVVGGVTAALVDDEGALLDGPTTVVALDVPDEGLQGQWMDAATGFEVVPHGAGALVAYEHWRPSLGVGPLVLSTEHVVRTARISVVDRAIRVDDDGRGRATVGAGHGVAVIDEDVVVATSRLHTAPGPRTTIEVERTCVR